MPAADAIEAFAEGWARSTTRRHVALTERALTACRICDWIAEAAPNPQATLQLGQLEGIWAVIYSRREAIEKLHAGALQDVLDAISQLDWGNVLDKIRQQAILDPNITGAQIQAQLGQAVEDLITSYLPEADRAAWAASMTQALLDGTAEGQVAGMSLVGDAAGIQIDWELAASEAKAALAGGQALSADAATWVGRQTQGMGYQIGRKLASMWDSGATADEMTTAIRSLLDVSRSSAAVLLDTAIGTALSRGAIATYQLADVGYVDFTTAGDGRVCETCAMAEAQGPYLLADVPDCPAHVRCRCCLSPSDYQPTAAVLQMLTAYQDPGTIDTQAA